MSGKGSAPRPLSVPRAEYDRRWQDTFAPEAPGTASTEIAGDGAPSGAQDRISRAAEGLERLGVPVSDWPILLCNHVHAVGEPE